jgi:hypothetical protein
MDCTAAAPAQHGRRAIPKPPRTMVSTQTARAPPTVGVANTAHSYQQPEEQLTTTGQPEARKTCSQLQCGRTLAQRTIICRVHGQ